MHDEKLLFVLTCVVLCFIHTNKLSITKLIEADEIKLMMTILLSKPVILS